VADPEVNIRNKEGKRTVKIADTDNFLKIKVIPHSFKDRKAARIATAILNQPENIKKINQKAERRMVHPMFFGSWEDDHG